MAALAVGGTPAVRCDQVDLAADKIRGQSGQPIVMALRPAVFDGYILPLDISCFLDVKKLPRTWLFERFVEFFYAIKGIS
jgi:hypothetical protein